MAGDGSLRPSVTRQLLQRLRIVRPKPKQTEFRILPPPVDQPLPLLPSPRPAIDTSKPTSSAPFFTKLPPEIRHAILVLAFGDQKVHMDFRLLSPLRDNVAVHRVYVETSHCFGKAPLFCADKIERRDRSKPREWHWWSCVCHNSYPPDHEMGRRQQEASSMGGWYRRPGQDMCVYGEGSHCWDWTKSKDPNQCSIGAMGWILSCRQACKEGADVLYATNTIFIESRTLLEEWFSASPRIDRFVSPDHLQSVTSLELVWDGTLFDRDGNPYGTAVVEEDRAFVAATLEHIGAATMPNVRFLTLVFLQRLFFHTDWTPPDFVAQVDELILQPVARAVARLPQPQTRPVIVLLPPEVFRRLSLQGPDAIGLGTKLNRSDGEWLVYPEPSASDRKGEYQIHGSA